MQGTRVFTEETTSTGVDGLINWMIALSFISFPILMLIGYATHPNLLSLSPVHSLDEWISEWHGNDLLHFGHVLVLFAVPLLIISALVLFEKVKTPYRGMGLLGTVLAVVGACFLAADKGALCLVNSAFDTLPAADFAQLTPGLAVMFSKSGNLVLVWLLVLLPLGFAILGMSLYRSRSIPRWQSIGLIVGSLLLMNPDIEIISLIACVILALVCIPIGMNELSNAAR